MLMWHLVKELEQILLYKNGILRRCVFMQSCIFMVGVVLVLGCCTHNSAKTTFITQKCQLIVQ